jgi:hypothetical protein
MPMDEPDFHADADCDGMCQDCDCGLDYYYTDLAADIGASYDHYHEQNLRTLALTEATKIIVAVNKTTAWVPLDTGLHDMLYNFLKGTSVPDPTPAPEEPAASDG